jgi:hypothetical protein
VDITARTYYEDLAVVLTDEAVNDGDIIRLPRHGLVAVATVGEGHRVHLHCLTELGELSGTPGLDEAPVSLQEQGRYAHSVYCGISIINQTPDNLIPYYNTRYRLLEHFVPHRTRERALYRFQRMPGDLVARCWYSPSGEDQNEQNFVGLMFYTGRRATKLGWSACHRKPQALGAFTDFYDAKEELIRYDQAATCAANAGQ